MEGRSLDIIINSIDYRGSIVDGPGVRTVIFLQGCVHLCQGCHNLCTWDPCEGTKWEITELVEDIKNNSRTKKITISGGEPLLQLNELIELISQLEYFDIALYTGYELENLPVELMKSVKYLKVGPFIKNKYITTEPFIGSSNQQFISMEEY